MPTSEQDTRSRQSAAKQREIRSALAELKVELRKLSRPSFEQKQRKRAARVPPLYTYDFETTNIGPGTPEPLYLTAYGVDFEFATPIESMDDLRIHLVNKILTPRFHGARFVAWNSNRFDAYFVAACLIHDSRFRLRPYLTRSKTLRGLRITLAEDGDTRTGRSWEFLDGIAMLGLTGLKLDDFLATFAPEYRKLTGIIDFEAGETFDCRNPKHCAYALRDSVGLWHGMMRAQSIMLSTFGEPLGVTMGGACIKIFAAHIPRGVAIRPVPPDVEPLIRDYVMRGGYCHLMRRVECRIWKYDVNQAYAAAMRDAALPCGTVMQCKGLPNLAGGPFIAQITASKPGNKIPFYCRVNIGGRIRTAFSIDRIHETWITSIEYRQLLAEGWTLHCSASYQWAESFNMREYVDKLERLRTTCEGGPKGAIGTMIKATGNHSYGKTVESIEPIDFIFAKECPPAPPPPDLGYAPYFGDGSDPMEHVFYRLDPDRRAKAHHQPQIGSFITAHVRMQIRRAALIDPDHFLYADTDCVCFSRDVTAKLDIDPARYGAWKIEETGRVYELIAKKVYRAKGDGKPTRAAKGMRVDRLTDADFQSWFEGSPPEQHQTQLASFVAAMHGADMYRVQRRKGTAVAVEKTGV